MAGPVFAAAVILDPSRPIQGLNDSKKITQRSRESLREEIESKALAWAVHACDVSTIDTINILNASIKAMQEAVRSLGLRPDHLLIDGNRFKSFDELEYTTVVKGDGIYQSIAAASILAKTHRDQYMGYLAKEFPQYGFEKHKGYGTLLHRQAIERFGYSEHHRKTFKLKNLQLDLFT